MYSDYRYYLGNNKGIALVASMGLTLIILVASLALVYRLTNFTKNIGTQREKTQTYYTATSGVEEIRDFFWNNDCIPPLWCGLLGNDLNPLDTDYPNIPDYSEVTVGVTGASSPSINATFFTLHIRDNNDDTDYTADNDEVILALATSSGQNETRTTVESMIIYTGDNAPYKQFGQTAKRRGGTQESNVGASLRQTF